MSDDLSPEEEAIYDAELAVSERLADDAILPYQRLLSRDEIAILRDQLIEVLMTHPNATALVAALAKRRASEVSGEVGEHVEPGAEASGGSAKK